MPKSKQVKIKKARGKSADSKSLKREPGLDKKLGQSKKLKTQEASKKEKIIPVKTSVKRRKQPTKGERGGLVVPVYNTLAKKIDQIPLPKEIFDAKINPVLMAQAVRVYRTNQRKGSAQVKTRGEVSYSTRKVRPQKGTGGARHGSAGAPIFVGGGRAHGPRVRPFNLSLPKKMRRRALFSALSGKLKTGGVIIVSGLEKIEPKTKKMAQIMDKFERGEILKGRKALLVLPEKLENLNRACRNLPQLTLLRAENLNTYEVLNHTNLIFLKKSIEKLSHWFLEGEKR